MKLRKSQMAALLLIALSLILGACMNTASSPEATQDPFTGAGTSTGLPAASATPGAPAQDATTLAGRTRKMRKSARPSAMIGTPTRKPWKTAWARFRKFPNAASSLAAIRRWWA